MKEYHIDYNVALIPKMRPGTRVGPYEVIAPIGSGGMGEVYRARDTKLDRDVALKVLPALFADDPERLVRFRREAHLLASLNHAHIAQVHGFEDSSGVAALVMELIDGPTLADRMASGPLPLEEARLIARQIAEALEAAHDRGIIHRDLKPANIKVADDGTVKVLDFGLAKALDSGAGPAGDALSSPTLTARATQLGVILGTAAYMAPEQARGRAVDKRADIWAFGVVLYEMLSGRRAFDGEEISDVMASVLRQEIDWSALPAATPPSIRGLLRRCLERDPKQRLRDIGEARIILESRGNHPDVVSELTSDPGEELDPSPSPDGKWVAFISDRTGRNEVILARFMAEGSTLRLGRRLPVSTGGGIDPFWRKDGREIVYLAPDRMLMSVRVDIAGEAVTLGKPTPLFPALADAGGWGANWAATPDLSKFVVVEARRATGQRFRLLTNWVPGQ
jgi:serine/threonine protein kinase